MKIKLKILALCCFLLVASVAQGHLLWASYSQCILTLGEPESCDTSDVPPATEACAFRNRAWGTLIHFWDRRAHWISSVKLDGSGVTAVEFQATLDAFADGNSWVKVSADEFRRSDRKVTAQLKGRSIEIYTEELMAAAALRQTYH